MQPDTIRPLINAIGTIAQITAARKRLRIVRVSSLPIMRHQLVYLVYIVAPEFYGQWL
jgi:hypothetical protein